jgi:hypothetical protein
VFEETLCGSLIAPAADRHVAYDHAALEQQLFDVEQAELEPHVPKHRVADDRRREPVAVIERCRFRHRAMYATTPPT